MRAQDRRDQRSHGRRQAAQRVKVTADGKELIWASPAPPGGLAGISSSGAPNPDPGTRSPPPGLPAFPAGPLVTESQHTPWQKDFPRPRSPVAVSSDPAPGAKRGDLTELSTFRSRAGGLGRRVGQSARHVSCGSCQDTRQRLLLSCGTVSCCGEGHCGHVSAQNTRQARRSGGHGHGRVRTERDVLSSPALAGGLPRLRTEKQTTNAALERQQRRSALSMVAWQPQGKPRETAVNSGPDERACPGSDPSPAPMPSVQR